MQGASQIGDSLFHAQESETFAVLGMKAFAIILNGNEQFRGALLHVDAHVLAA